MVPASLAVATHYLPSGSQIVVVGDSLVPGLNFLHTWRKVVWARDKGWAIKCKVIVVCGAFAKMLHISSDLVPHKELGSAILSQFLFYFDRHHIGQATPEEERWCQGG